MKIIKRLMWLALPLLGVVSAQADEGMWLMQQLRRQYPEMQQRGLKLKAHDIYNEQGTSLRDAVVIFGRGCTGEVISSQGLVLTNHHCGYDAIQGLSSVEHNYLQDGYWAPTLQDELPARGLTVTFIDKIEDVTDYVQARLKAEGREETMDYLSPKYLEGLAKDKAGALPGGTEVEIRAFYNGNRYLMFTKKVYSDIRFVGAPPSAIGKFGADTDNWAYPRHTGDFSIFRIYADASGNPAPYSVTNVPLRPKRWFSISTGGVQPGDFTMIMGFPGRTNRFFLPEEVQEWKAIDNDIRIRMRAIRQEEMLAEMLKDPKVNIQYAAKYASSQNAYKRAIGANWGIEVRHLGKAKAEQMNSLLAWATPEERPKYERAIADIRTVLEQRSSLRRRLWYIMEGFIYGMEFVQLPQLVNKPEADVRDFYRDYDPQVEAKITKALLHEYLRQVPESERPKTLTKVLQEAGGVDALVEILLKSNYMTEEGLKKIRQQQSEAERTKQERSYEHVTFHGKLIAPDRVLEEVASAIAAEYRELNQQLASYDHRIERARRTYVGGLLAQHGDALWPDANSTLRFTYGEIKGYSPRDGVYYAPQTTLSGVMAKADSTSWEFAIPKKLEEIYKRQSYGQGNRWAERQRDGSWQMPVNFIATTHTTGGNSGSPVLNAQGHLIGINFDRNWEGVGGDIQYLPDYQRSIICDVRYILMLIEEYGGSARILQELNLVR